MKNLLLWSFVMPGRNCFELPHIINVEKVPFPITQNWLLYYHC